MCRERLRRPRHEPEIAQRLAHRTLRISRHLLDRPRNSNTNFGRIAWNCRELPGNSPASMNMQSGRSPRNCRQLPGIAGRSKNAFRPICRELPGSAGRTAGNCQGLAGEVKKCKSGQEPKMQKMHMPLTRNVRGRLQAAPQVKSSKNEKRVSGRTANFWPNCRELKGIAGNCRAVKSAFPAEVPGTAGKRRANVKTHKGNRYRRKRASGKCGQRALPIWEDANCTHLRPMTCRRRNPRFNLIRL